MRTRWFRSQSRPSRARTGRWRDEGARKPNSILGFASSFLARSREARSSCVLHWWRRGNQPSKRRHPCSFSLLYLNQHQSTSTPGQHREACCISASRLADNNRLSAIGLGATEWLELRRTGPLAQRRIRHRAGGAVEQVVDRTMLMSNTGRPDISATSLENGRMLVHSNRIAPGFLQDAGACKASVISDHLARTCSTSVSNSSRPRM